MAVNRKVDGSNPSGRVFRPITSYWLARLIMFVSDRFGDMCFAFMDEDAIATHLNVESI